MKTRKPSTPEKKEGPKQDSRKRGIKDLPAKGKGLTIKGGACATGSHFPSVRL